MLGQPLPSDPQRAKVVVPAVRALDDPTSRLFAANRPSECRLSPTTNMGFDVSTPRLAFGLFVIVALVEAEVVGHPSTVAPAQYDRVERLADHVHVVDVGAGQRNAERNSLSVGEDVAFRPELAAIGRVGSSELPPFGAFTETLSRDAHAQSIPTCWS